MDKKAKYKEDYEKRKEYHRKYREKNKDKQKEWQENNKDKVKERKKHYGKVYKQTPAAKKTDRITNWKLRGVICDDWDVLYERYLNTKFCEECNVELTIDKRSTKTTRCLDHCHTTGEVRNILCHPCNTKRG